MKDLTPRKYKNSNTSIFRDGDNYVIIGKRYRESLEKLGDGEIAIEIPEDLLKNLKKFNEVGK